MRVNRVVIPDVACHLTQKGNYGQTTFFDRDDREYYLARFTQAAQEYSLDLLGWCLMTNHVHWIVVPRTTTSMADTIRRAHAEYALYLNRKQGRISGHLWQARFYSCVLAGTHFWRALRYVELNPVRAGLVEVADEYLYSSAAVHTGRQSAPSWLNLEIWRQEYNTVEWRQFLTLRPEEDWVGIRHATRTGRLWGEPCHARVGRPKLTIYQDKPETRNTTSD
ncbi:MAG: transposase [Acidobacteriaceae bacterium]|nr:transposase [Acidobacteriaceae bacterium]